jgi:hypothetical protein
MASKFFPTSILITKNQYEMLKQISYFKNRSIASLVREAIDEFLSLIQKPEKK